MQHKWKINYTVGFRTLSKCSSAYKGEKSDFKIFSLLVTVPAVLNLNFKNMLF